MRFNERELKFVARTGVTEKEGNLRYRNPYAKRDGMSHMMYDDETSL
jgi:hypothetical protein